MRDRLGKSHTLALPSPLDVIRCYAALDAQHVAIGSDFGIHVFDLANERVIRSMVEHTVAGPEAAVALAAAGDLHPQRNS